MACADRTVYRSVAAAKTKRHWRTYADVALAPLTSTEPSPSLSPGPNVILRYVDGDPVAQAVIAAWEPRIGFASLIKEVYV